MISVYHKLFTAYPYKKFQLNFLKISPADMATHYASLVEKDFLKQTIEINGQVHGLLSLSPLTDFSQFIGFPVYLLKNYLVMEEKAQELYPKLEEHLSKVILNLTSNHCLVAKLPIDNHKGINSLLKLGFYHVGGESVFSLNLSSLKAYDDVALNLIRPGEKKD